MTTKEWLDEVAKSALCTRTTLQATYDAACAVIRNGVPGDFVECGVWAGANSAVMAKATSCYGGRGRRVHLFDSFEGIPEAGPNDVGWTHPEGTSACSIETTKQQMKAWGIPDELLVYHPGWFKDTMQDARNPWDVRSDGKGAYIHTIALLRLDADLYESTRVCMEHLYPLVSPGGIVIVDDYRLSGCRRAVNEYFMPDGSPGPIYFFKD